MWKGNKHKSMKWTNKQNWREQLDRAKIFDKMIKRVRIRNIIMRDNYNKCFVLHLGNMACRQL